MEKINWGIIGCGDVCEKKSGPAFYKIEHSALTAVMRRDEAKVKDFAKRHNIPKYYTDTESLLNDPEIKAIYVATPPNTHKEYAIMAMRAGKAVYVEKPMAINYDDCLEMIKVSEKCKQKLFVAFYRRELPYFLKVKELIEKGCVGDILTVNTVLYKRPQESDKNTVQQTWRVNKSIAGEGYFYDLAPHTLDILDFLLGEIEFSEGYSKNIVNLYDVKDTITAIYQFRSGTLGTGLWSFVTSKCSEQDTIEIIGTKGKIIFSTFSFTPIQLITDFNIESFAFTSPEHIQQPLIQSIVNELRGIGICPSNGYSGARTSRIMDLILKNK